MVRTLTFILLISPINGHNIRNYSKQRGNPGSCFGMFWQWSAQISPPQPENLAPVTVCHVSNQEKA
jgi:hypothetical protein